MSVQTADELDRFYDDGPDPWGFATHPDDAKRREHLLAAVAGLRPDTTLDVGCGNGFVTTGLPGRRVLGIDLSEAALGHAATAAQTAGVADRVTFATGDVLRLAELRNHPAAPAAGFDLVVLTGVLYPQYIGGGLPTVAAGVDAVLAPGGHLVLCHIDAWWRGGFAYPRLGVSLYRYREFTHRLEVHRKPTNTTGAVEGAPAP